LDILDGFFNLTLYSHALKILVFQSRDILGTNARGVQTESVSTQYLELSKGFVEVLPSFVVCFFCIAIENERALYFRISYLQTEFQHEW
jgi:hypothetical protein